MKSIQVALFSVLLSPTLYAHAARQIFPAGSLISCRITEAKLSSKTAALATQFFARWESLRAMGRDACPLTVIWRAGLKTSRIQAISMERAGWN